MALPFSPVNPPDIRNARFLILESEISSFAVMASSLSKRMRGLFEGAYFRSMTTWDSLKPMLCFLKSFGSDDEGGVPPCGGIPGICGRPPDCCATRERGSTQAMTVPPRRMYWSKTNSVLGVIPAGWTTRITLIFSGSR